ncbi:hypothetical protein LTS12_029222, partial [Elasticomyces elasticus]
MVPTSGKPGFRVLGGLSIHGGHAGKTRRSTTRASISVRGFGFMEGFGGEEDGAVKAVRKATMATTKLHGDDDEFGDDFEFAHERRVDARV